jgi:hypothetical protein
LHTAYAKPADTGAPTSTESAKEGTTSTKARKRIDAAYLNGVPPCDDHSTPAPSGKRRRQQRTKKPRKGSRSGRLLGDVGSHILSPRDAYFRRYRARTVIPAGIDLVYYKSPGFARNPFEASPVRTSIRKAIQSPSPEVSITDQLWHFQKDAGQPMRSNCIRARFVTQFADKVGIRRNTIAH